MASGDVENDIMQNRDEAQTLTATDGTQPAQTEGLESRGNWTGRFDFFMSCLSFAVGLGNLWRFPYLCYRNGGGAFLIPYVLMMIFVGMPLFFLELTFGQFAGRGVINIWAVTPMMTGIGYAMFFVSFFVGIYYTMVIAWAFYYTFASFAADVPWKTCDNPWNSPSCSEPAQFRNCSQASGVWFNFTCWTRDEYGNETFDLYEKLSEELGRRSASYEYFHNKVLNLSSNIDELSTPQWPLVLCLLLAWIIVYFCLIKGIKSSGKMVYFTAIFPYIVLIILLGRASTLDGAIDGVVFYVKPNWTRLATAEVWGDAAIQIFFSLAPCWGGLITLASYNQFNNNALSDAIVVTLSNCGTSVFAGFVIFAVLGFMAKQLQLKISEVAVSGAGLAFIAYPEVVAQLPISPLWSILFFLMLITLGLGTQITTINTVHTTILDLFADKLRKGHRPKLVLFCICTVCFLLGLTLTCRGGMFMLQLMDNYAATYSALIIGVTECITLSWLYGWERLSEDIELMLGRKPALWWRIMWQFVTPGVVLFVLVFTLVEFKRTNYDGIVLPPWADAMGWLLSMASVVPIFVYLAVYLATHRKGTIMATLSNGITPTDIWGPADKTLLEDYKRRHSKRNKRSSSSLDENLPMYDTKH